MAVWYLEKAQHTLEDQIFGSKMGELDLIILEHQW
jgi:Holliday junction resolvase-like predicted endonuclease